MVTTLSRPSLPARGDRLRRADWRARRRSADEVLFTFGEMQHLQSLPLESTKRTLTDEEVTLYQNFELYAYTVFETLEVANQAASRDQAAVVLRPGGDLPFPQGRRHRPAGRLRHLGAVRADRARSTGRSTATTTSRRARCCCSGCAPLSPVPARAASGPALAADRRADRPPAPPFRAWSRRRAVLYRRGAGCTRAWTPRVADSVDGGRVVAWPPRPRSSLDHEAAQHAHRPQGDLRAGRSEAADDVCLRPDRLQLPPHRQRPRGGRVRRPVPAAEAALRRCALRPQRHRRRGQDHQGGGRARRLDRGGRGGVHPRLSRGHGRAERAQALRRAVRDRAHPGHAGDDRGPDRERPRLCGRGPRAVPRAVVRGLRPAVAALARRDDRRRPGRGRALQARSRGLRALEALERPSSPAGTARGAAAGRAGTSSARRWSRRISGSRSTSTAAARTSSSRTTRTSSPRASARTAARRSPASGCTTAFSTSSARRCRSRSATFCWCATCWREAPGEAIRYALLAAHYRKPLDWSDAGLARAKQALDRLYLTLRDLPGPDEPTAARRRPACWPRSRTT